MKTMSESMSLESLKTQIEAMNKTQHIEILKILRSNPLVKLNENKSGVYINLSFLPMEILSEVQEYVHYIQDQESSLKSMEYQKQEFKNIFFTEKENKDEMAISYISSK
jgi:subtilase family serine protease